MRCVGFGDCEMFAGIVNPLWSVENGLNALAVATSATCCLLHYTNP